MKVRVYYNLHKHVYSVQHYIKGKGWRLYKHLNKVYLEDVEFKVYEIGRQRVLQEKRKNVHAYVIGTLKDFKRINDICTVTYNPYYTSSFIIKANKAPVKNAKAALLTKGRKIYATM